MSQLLGIISLKCPNCGAGISVTPELDVFACGYCGAHMGVSSLMNDIELACLLLPRGKG
jgi:DNA-directed RNA polymerase subunit RPC12/RpoP